MYLYYDYLGKKRSANTIDDLQQGSYLGPEYGEEEIEDFLNYKGYKYHKIDDYAKEIARLLSEQKVIGFFSGRMKYGPRALGHRSILADPRNNLMQSKLNLKIKNRESFRPFARLY